MLETNSSQVCRLNYHENISMKKKDIGKILFISLTLFYIYPLCTRADGDREHSANNFDLSSLVKELSDSFLAGKLNVNTLEKKLFASAVQAENKEYWSVDSNTYNMRSTVKASDKMSPISVLQLNTNELSQLNLKDLENLFGKSRILVSSKNPWVKFTDKKRHDGKNVSVSAELYSPPEAEVSPVLLLKLILENSR